MRKETKLLLYILLLSINLPTSANSLIWETDFSSESEFNEWSIYDTNEDENTWNFSVGEEPSVSIEYIKNNPSYKIYKQRYTTCLAKNKEVLNGI
ncbi:MAG: hypothetical protein IKB97_04605 [Bacteroidaceae bacterium]|nr:hypothetical protein [Bacteroidaceae bacterium]